jgi:hypothetical protein
MSFRRSVKTDEDNRKAILVFQGILSKKAGKVLTGPTPGSGDENTDMLSFQRGSVHFLVIGIEKRNFGWQKVIEGDSHLIAQAFDFLPAQVFELGSFGECVSVS